MSETPPVMLTDARPVPADDRCPRCHAPASKRLAWVPFGAVEPRTSCGACGYEWREGAERG